MYKKGNNEDLVFGIHSVKEALLSTSDFEKILVQKNIDKEVWDEIFPLAKQKNVPIQRVPMERLQRVTQKNHQGVIAYISAVNYADVHNIVSACYDEGRMPLILALDRVTDVRNFGAIARTAECAGVDAILIPDKESAQIGSDALKTSSGALSHMPVCRSKSFINELKSLRDAGLSLVACTEKRDQLVFDCDFTSPTVIVMGSEESGISNEVLKIADQYAKVPMFGKIGSMNVSVAAGIITYEAIRQRQ